MTVGKTKEGSEFPANLFVSEKEGDVKVLGECWIGYMAQMSSEGVDEVIVIGGCRVMNKRQWRWDEEKTNPILVYPVPLSMTNGGCLFIVEGKGHTWHLQPQARDGHK
ncbi:hypothetical protein TREMEDRAFT_65721 [Tremella mesenterica DSM 1558]|uniref:uncharacterized protein n=1 Tax=Tremella mesenterica (strain ATCC 24925 / CBS 8224 / DSM 1558 / NBRC 9311 / NRRL Y-6157 / RJB 2259-6 / UBC 559-6) TaxID=578456 RepID=UPI00032BBD8E|nr:uncharacterized protein TREMEDRAFT_65721 [Tremella mesenterica DSM 1558]EIW66128.1 hypothetical protein TREMEDRAFT_65721 [Tremella mesenterica DSM 1558]